MKTDTLNLELNTDRRADRTAYSVAFVFTLLSWIILSNTEQLESAKAGQSLGWRDPWFTQGTSHWAILIAILIIPMMLSRWPISLENWKRKVPIYLCGFFAFGAIHIIFMDIFRSLSFPVFLGRPYSENFLDVNLWIYELRKDAYTYLLVLSAFIASRQVEQLRLEVRQAYSDAKSTGRLTLKSGGRVIFLQANEIVWVEAASNYLEVHTETGQHLVRMTLGALESLLMEAGNAHLKIHRSYLVKREAVQEVVPTGDGKAIAKLSNGKELAISRKYRDEFR